MTQRTDCHLFFAIYDLNISLLPALMARIHPTIVLYRVIAHHKLPHFMPPNQPSFTLDSLGNAEKPDPFEAIIESPFRQVD